MSIEGADHYFVRCEHPGCMAGYLGWGEKCPDCEGGWITIPEVATGNMIKSVLIYSAFVSILGAFIYAIFR